MVDSNLQKHVRCPSCQTVLTSTGSPGEVVIVTCPSCGTRGKVTFPLQPVFEYKPVIQTHQLTKRFGSFTAVDNLSFTVRQGEIYGLIGPNGSGKTTIIKMLCRLLRPSSGNATILGQPFSNKPVMTEIGYMPQETALYVDNTVHENLMLFGRIYCMSKEQLIPREQEMLRFVNLEEWRDTLVSTLSGGMKHRVSLACALLHEPRLLFLDEPTVGVDPELRATFWGYFERITKQGVTVLITTHYLDEADRCSRVGLLRQGHLIAEGSPQQLKAETGTTSLEQAFCKLAGRTMV